MHVTSGASDGRAGGILLAHHVYRLLNSVEAFTGVELTYLRPRVLEAAAQAAGRLHERADGDEDLARRTCQLLFGNNDPEPAFWATDLGADIAWHIGYPQPVVPVWAAAAVLRVHRQTVWRHVRIHGELSAGVVRDRARRSRRLRIQ